MSNSVKISGMFIVILGIGFCAMTILQMGAVLEYDSPKITNMCWQVWSNMLTSALFNLLSGAVAIVAGMTIYGEGLNGDNSDGGYTILLYGLIPKFVFNIWSCMIYFCINNDCKNEYDDNAPKLMTFLQAEVILSLIVYSVVSLACCTYGAIFTGVFFTSCNKSYNEQSDIDRTYHTKIDNFESLNSLGVPGAKTGTRFGIMLSKAKAKTTVPVPKYNNV